MALPSVFDALDEMSGSAGEAAQVDYASAPQAYETPDDTSRRIVGQNTQRIRYGKAKAEDLAQRGIANYTTQEGDTREVTDWTGTPLSSADKRNKIAYDSTGAPVDYNGRDETGKPVVHPAFEGIADWTDPKSGDIYKRHPKLQWQWQGQGADVAAQLEQAKQQKLNRETATALAAPEAQARAAVTVATRNLKASAKQTQVSLSTLGVPLIDATGQPAIDLGDDTPDVRTKVEQSFNGEFGSREANEAPWFGGGKYSPAAEAYRADIARRKEEALSAVDRHQAVLRDTKARAATLEEIALPRTQLAGDRLMDVNAKRVAAGMEPVSIPGLQDLSGAATARSDAASGMEPFIEAAPDNSLIPGLDAVGVEDADSQDQSRVATVADGSHKPVEASSILAPATSPQSEGLIATIGRELTTKLAPAIGTAVGAAGGAIAGGVGGTAVALGPGTVAGAIAGDITGALLGGAAVDKAQQTIMEGIDPGWSKRNEAQMEANRKEHPMAAQLGSMVPFLISMIGGPGGLVRAGEQTLGRAITKSGKAALEAGKAAPLVERSAESAVKFARAQGSEAAQEKYVEGHEDVSVLDQIAKGALSGGAVGVFPAAKSILMAATGKAVEDAAAMIFAQHLYDKAVHGKEIDFQEVANEMGGDVPAFMLQNAIMGLVARHPLVAPKKGGELPPSPGVEPAQPEPPSPPSAESVQEPVPPEVTAETPVAPVTPNEPPKPEQAPEQPPQPPREEAAPVGEPPAAGGEVADTVQSLTAERDAAVQSGDQKVAAFAPVPESASPALTSTPGAGSVEQTAWRKNADRVMKAIPDTVKEKVADLLAKDKTAQQVATELGLEASIVRDLRRGMKIPARTSLGSPAINPEFTAWKEARERGVAQKPSAQSGQEPSRREVSAKNPTGAGPADKAPNDLTKDVKTPEVKAPAVQYEVTPKDGVIEGRDNEAITVSTWRGSGRKETASIYGAGAEGAALGSGAYHAISESDAKHYGPNVKVGKVTLQRPFVLDSDKKLKALFGAEIPYENKPRNALLQKARKKIEAAGHDGVIVNIPHDADVNERGESFKRLREIFGHTQVVEFKPEAEPSRGIPNLDAPAKPAEAKPSPPEPTHEQPTSQEAMAHGGDTAKLVEPSPEVAKAAGRQADAPDTSSKKLKVQKAYLLDALDKAHQEAPDELPDAAKKLTSEYEAAIRHADQHAQLINSGLRAPYGETWTDEQLAAKKEEIKTLHAAAFKARAEAEKAWSEGDIPRIEIEVPGDGTFRIVNTKAAIKSFHDTTKKEFPSVTSKASMPRIPNLAESKIPPLGKPKVAGDFIKIAGIAASTDENRKVINYVHSDGRNIVGTDGSRLIVLTGKAGGTEAKPALFEPKTLKTVTKDKEGDPLKFPNWKQVIPTDFKEEVKEVDAAALMKLTIQAQSMTSEKSRSAMLWKDADGRLGMSSNTPDVGMFVGGEADPQTAKPIMALNPEYLIDGLRIARALGHDKVSLQYVDEQAPLKIVAKGMEYVLMPMRMEGGYGGVHPLADNVESKSEGRPSRKPKGEPPMGEVERANAVRAKVKELDEAEKKDQKPAAEEPVELPPLLTAERSRPSEIARYRGALAKIEARMEAEPDSDQWNSWNSTQKKIEAKLRELESKAAPEAKPESAEDRATAAKRAEMRATPEAPAPEGYKPSVHEFADHPEVKALQKKADALAKAAQKAAVRRMDIEEALADPQKPFEEKIKLREELTKARAAETRTANASNSAFDDATVKMHELAKAARRPPETTRESRVEEADKAGGEPLAPDAISGHLRDRFDLDPARDNVRIRNEPDAAWDARAIMRDGKLQRIEINAAKVRSPEQLERVVLEELGHGFTEDPANAKATKAFMDALTQEERADIRAEIDRLGYGEEAKPFEERAKALRDLADKYRSAPWYRKLLAQIVVWAHKAGLKLTHAGAEKLAADAAMRTVADVKGETPRGIPGLELARASKKDVSPEVVKRDRDYAAAVASGNVAEQQRHVDEAAKWAGYDGAAFHGTPSGGFTVFEKRPTYFSTDKPSADVFKSSSASSIRSWAIPKDATPETKSVYLKTGRVFDTRKPEHAEIFRREFFGKGGKEWSSNETPLSSRNLPDWTDGRDLVDWITEEKKPFDSIILDEGSLPTMEGGVKWRGPSIVVWKPKQIKSADPITRDDAGRIIPPSERFNPKSNDIRESRTDPHPSGAQPRDEEGNFAAHTFESLKRSAAPGLNILRDMKGGIQSLMLPSMKSPEHLAEAERLGADLGAMNRRQESSRAQTSPDWKTFARMGLDRIGLKPADNHGIKFMSAMSQGRAMGEKLQAVADKIKGQFQARLDALEKVGANLRTIRENYFPGMWTTDSRRAFNLAMEEARKAGVIPQEGFDVNGATADQKAWVKERTDKALKTGEGSDTDGLAYLTKRPLKGGESFRKQKVFDDIMDAAEFGLRPFSNNPIDLVNLKLAEMDRSLMANEHFAKLQADEKLKVIDPFHDVPQGWVKLDDKYGTIYGPPDVKISEAFDKNQVEALNKVADALNIPQERRTKIGGTRWGYQQTAGNPEVVTKFAGPESVIAHEIGHAIDDRYNVHKSLLGHPDADQRRNFKKELRALADLRFEGQETSEHFQRYVRKGVEKAAVMVESYIHAPEKFKEAAPHVYEWFDNLVKSDPKLAGLKDAKPSLVLGSAGNSVSAGGLVIAGYRVVPKEVGEVLNNYLSSSLYNNPYFGKMYTGWMGLASALNQAQLGVGSAFHAGFTALESQLSAGANLFKDIYGVARGNRSMKQLGNTTVKFGTAMGQFRTTGDKLLNAWRNPDAVIDPHMQQLVRATELAGGGFNIERGMETTQAPKAFSAFHSGNFAEAAARSPVAALELMARPMMHYLVPRQKAAVFAHLAGRIIEQNPGKSLEELTPEFRQAWNRTDARLGQVRYDRLFMNNTAKNVVQGTVRAPGWTGGTIAELGGAFRDTAKFFKEWKETGKLPQDLPDRVAYTASLLLGVAATNAVLTYAFTGEQPKDIDYWAFRTGGEDEHGHPERFVLPTYMKDLLAYSKEPLTTIGNKAHPMLSLIHDLWRNQDYYGVKIRNEDDSALKNAADSGKYFAKAFEPFWIRGARRERERGGSITKQAASFIGVMPAPKKMTQTKAEELADKYAHETIPIGGRTQEQADISKAKYKLVQDLRQHRTPDFATAIRTGAIKASEVPQLVARAQLSPIQYQVKKLSLDKAESVFRVASDVEKRQLAPILALKRSNAIKKNAPPLGDASRRPAFAF